MDYRYCSQRTASCMNVIQIRKPEIGYLITIQRKEGFIRYVTRYGETKPFCCPSFHGMNTILDVDAESCAVTKVINYLLLEICHSQNKVCNIVLSKPFNDPFKHHLVSDLNHHFRNILSDRPEPSAFAAG